MRRPPAAVREPSWETGHLKWAPITTPHMAKASCRRPSSHLGSSWQKTPLVYGLRRVSAASRGRQKRVRGTLGAHKAAFLPSSALQGRMQRLLEGLPPYTRGLFCHELAIFRGTLGPGLDAPGASCPPLPSHIAISQGWGAAAQRPAGHCLWHAHCPGSPTGLPSLGEPAASSGRFSRSNAEKGEKLRCVLGNDRPR